MPQSLKNISDSIFELLTKFSKTDENSIDETWMYYKINQVRADLIRREFANTNYVDQSWLSDLSLLTCYEVNFADNNTVGCTCPISKTTIPQIITLNGKNGNQDLGLYSVISSCGTQGYYTYPISRWKSTPPEHTNSLSRWYFRINTQLYLSRVVDKVRVIAVLLDPLEGFLSNSAPIASGSIVLATVYYVSPFGGSVIYDGNSYAPGSTFTGTATTTFTTVNGVVYLNSQVASYIDTYAYPASGEMIRNIELEILTKEFNIERQAIVDERNDSTDDTTKVA